MKAKLSFVAPRLQAMDTRTARPEPKRADPHYGSAEHRIWSAEIIRRSGGAYQVLIADAVASGCSSTTLLNGRTAGLSSDRLGQALCGGCHTRKTAEDAAGARQNHAATHTSALAFDRQPAASEGPFRAAERG
jgi:5-methylcytosine-specific restriction protein A